ncbi:MAG: peptidylprolyl isomerase [Microcoleus sp. PH2017_29_MFU_D_A]|jgi:peptidylprolyl isomerase|uniref:peptidylprolyl isomerase n=1 Tax=unclassified Microcoleus TaxID=2642155 RepID=UPI001D73BE6A|nr:MULTISPECIES: peptidylprolyl isomerase [unclassified Microcoleus]MCC3421887.1 peptidylprolyl isomerase [Microcoleus sp. PH2017_07_MST_O_A]MCC3432106.1 peptidylprolyl isomerase [Microcoleus sp. PH2017_04_SCI_O_A]MCC3444628.1 peptidylprolyl isomerase [Microcoleus sp. PH2017_03_ELD_O_A]MCC3468893.1 peptidylprolyl isomerase [Microcoleus sp. PH2017_06_SFM_O_A]MCC3513461.1 peptidylprolyl isomerase [Microcoleus sp. PH2017_17_BER_D_A]
MLHWPNFSIDTCKRWVKTGALAVLLFALSLSFSAVSYAKRPSSSMPAGNPITDGRALLRFALPIDNQTVRELQISLEDIGNHIRSKRWGPISSDVSKASRILSIRESDILVSIPEAKQPEAEALVAQVKEGIAELEKAVEAKDREKVIDLKAKILGSVGEIEELMVTKFPFEVPAKYANLPQLKGRATVAVETDKGTINVVVDGYSAPVTAGNFVDLVDRGFYDGLPFIRSEESYVLQTGDPEGKEVGFIDPGTGKYRNVPLEVLVREDKEPVYGITLEDAGRYRDEPVLPFSAFGAVAMARAEAEPDSGSSQFFFFLFEPELTPAGLNLLDGRYAVFGYMIEGKEVLDKLRQGDKIISAKVIKGKENLVQPQV